MILALWFRKWLYGTGDGHKHLWQHVEYVDHDMQSVCQWDICRCALQECVMPECNEVRVFNDGFMKNVKARGNGST